jgi:hypothetical protein
MEDDRAVDEITHVFLQARQICRNRKQSWKAVSFEEDAIDLLTNYTLLLGPLGLADAMQILAEEQVGRSPVTCPQVALVIASVLDTSKGKST